MKNVLTIVRQMQMAKKDFALFVLCNIDTCTCTAATVTEMNPLLCCL